VTQYLRKVWLDAVKADYLNKVISGEVAGDRAKAVDEFHTLLKQHADYDKLREIFMPDLKV
jgi:hypothetical protein